MYFHLELHSQSGSEADLVDHDSLMLHEISPWRCLLLDAIPAERAGTRAQVLWERDSEHSPPCRDCGWCLSPVTLPVARCVLPHGYGFTQEVMGILCLFSGEQCLRPGHPYTPPRLSTMGGEGLGPRREVGKVWQPQRERCCLRGAPNQSAAADLELCCCSGV